MSYYKRFSDKSVDWLVRRLDELYKVAQKPVVDELSRQLNQDCFEIQDEILREFVSRELIELYKEHSKKWESVKYWTEYNRT